MTTLQTHLKCRRLPYMARLNVVPAPQREMPIMLFAAVMGAIVVLMLFSIL